MLNSNSRCKKGFEFEPFNRRLLPYLVPRGWEGPQWSQNNNIVSTVITLYYIIHLYFVNMYTRRYIVNC